jgi:choline dehydrogenase-like flavoprotein
MIEAEYDVIVVGAGAGGAIAAALLAEAGKSVLLLERGRWMGYADVGRDHLRNQRLPRYGHNLGPPIEGHPRVFVSPSGEERQVRPHEEGYHNNAAAVGGATVVYGAQAWRFVPLDFRMASTYGVPEGSSLADWPLSYEELEPVYERAEWEIGVCGDGRQSRLLGQRGRGYPMPPVPDNPERKLLGEAAGGLGWEAGPVPLAINSVPYGGRPACIRCGVCIGFACPTDSKNGTQNTMVPRALATGRCTLVTDAMAERIETDDGGRVIGVTFFVAEDGQPKRKSARARAIVVSCGAIESARLLLNSASPNHPRGLGNEFDQVGRHLQGHYYPGALGFFEQETYDGNGPGVSIATWQFNHGNTGIIGGAMLANEFIKTPIQFWHRAWPPGMPRWGLVAKRFMRDNYRRLVHVQGPVQEIPSPDARVTLDPRVRDKFGIPVARLSGTTHPETVRTSLFMRGKAEQWLRAAGAKTIYSGAIGLRLSAGQHQAGTCRMGSDPNKSVTDSWGCVHGHDNLLVMDGSLHVTNGGFNPALTIMALAFRCAERLAKDL